MPVAFVAGVLGGEDFLVANVFAAGLEIEIAALGPLSLVGREKDFALGVWEDHGGLVAPLGDDARALGRGTLPFDELLANGRVVGGVLDRNGNVVGADFLGDVAAVDKYAVVEELDTDLARQLGEGLGVGEIEAALLGGPGYGPVHGARVEEPESQPPG